MSAEIIKVFEYIGDKLGITIDWTQDNIIPYLKDLVARFVKLNIIEDVIGIIVWGILLVGIIVLGIIIIKKFYKCFGTEGTKGDSIFWQMKVNHYSKDELQPTGVCIFCIIFGVVLGACSLTCLPICISELIKWIYVPEMQILYEVKHTIQSMGG